MRNRWFIALVIILVALLLHGGRTLWSAIHP